MNGDCLMASVTLTSASSFTQDISDDAASIESHRRVKSPKSHASGTAASEEMSDHDFNEYFQSKPLEAVHTLLLFVDLELVSKSDATKWIFPCLVKVHGELREYIYKALLDLEEPSIILSTALNEYDNFGNAERLVLAASLLEAIGVNAFPVLRVMARSNRAECDFFIHAITHLSGVSSHDRLTALTDLARNPHADVRYSLPEALRFFSPQDALPLLQMLSVDEDEDIADEAREYLESAGLTA